jgi:hypothetical protein
MDLLGHGKCDGKRDDMDFDDCLSCWTISGYAYVIYKAT